MSRLEAEILEAPAAVERFYAANRDALAECAARFARERPRALFTLARGSSDAAATFAAYRLAAAVGLLTGSLPPSLGGLGASPLDARQVWVLTISQSGKSADLVQAFGRVRGEGQAAFSLALVNDTRSPLAQSADRVLDQAAGPELSIAATKSFQASLAGVDALAAALAGQPIEARLAALARALERPTAGLVDLELLIPATSALVLARGPALAAAQELALKLKETAGLHAEAVSAAEVMHGPKALAKGGVAVLALIGGGAFGESTRSAASHLEALGARVARIELSAGDPVAVSCADHEPARLVQAFYSALPGLARARGQDPDHPPHLAKVTSTR